MSIPEEHDYIGLSEAGAVAPSPSSKNKVVNLKETELRLGLPGSERKGGAGVSLFGKDLKDEKKSFVSGAKRGFCDAINGAGKWGLSINGGSEGEKGKSEALFSPRGANASNNSSKTANKEIPVEERKNQPSNTAPASK